MKAKKFLTLSALVVLIGLVGGCHYKTVDGYRGYGYGSRYGSYRDGFRDGRRYERRDDDRRESRYYDRWGNYRGRW